MRRLVAVFVSLALVGGAGAAALAEEPPPPDDAPEVLRIAAPFGGAYSPEGAAFQAELDAYAADRNVEIVIEPLGDLDQAIAGDDHADLVVEPQPAALRDYADHLVDIGSWVKPDKMRRDYSPYLVDAASVDGAVVGVPVNAALKSIVWYRPDAFAAYGYEVPTTFDELVALSDRMVADGRTPWCNYMESGFATGWLATDWIEDLLLGAEGPAVYDQWVTHDVLFQDPRVEAAFERYLQMMDTPGYVFDRANLTDTSFAQNVFPLGSGECLMHKQGAFFSAFLGSVGFDVGEFSTFPFPAVDQAYAEAAMGGGNYVGAVTDSTEVRQLVWFMASQRFGTHAIADSDTGWVMPNVRFDLDRYGDDMTRSFAETIRTAVATDQFRFDASDLMPPEVGAGAFWVGMTELTDGVWTIPEVLADIDAAWPE